MITKDLKGILTGLSEGLSNNPRLLALMLPSGEFIPDHFHITEVGKLTKSFVDCGGTRRETSSCFIQIWTGNDYNHRLSLEKFREILEIGCCNELDDLPVEIEYGPNIMSRYYLDYFNFTSDPVILMLKGKQTGCLAPEKCGGKGSGVKKCCGNKGCC